MIKDDKELKKQKENKDWVGILPISADIIIKKLEKFDSKSFEVCVKFTNVLKIKFYGLDIRLIQRPRRAKNANSGKDEL